MDKPLTHVEQLERLQNKEHLAVKVEVLAWYALDIQSALRHGKIALAAKHATSALNVLDGLRPLLEKLAKG